MNASIASLTNAPTPIQLGTRSFNFSALDHDSLGKLQIWLNGHVPDHIGLARRLVEGLPAEATKDLIREAYADAKKAMQDHQIGQAGAMALLSTLGGLKEICCLSLQQNHPDVSRETASALLGGLGLSQMNRIYDIALDVADDKAEGDDEQDGGDSDPKGD